MNKTFPLIIVLSALVLVVSEGLDEPKELITPMAVALGLEPPPPPVDSVQGPLVDSLVGVFKGMTVAIKHNRPDVFMAFLDPEEEGKLQVTSVSYGYESLKTYLMNQGNYWPDPDTLIVFDLVTAGNLARLTFAGEGAPHPSYGPQRRYTFVLYRRTDNGWKMAALTALDKAATDRFGYPVAYHDTELPAKLRFPRFF